MEYVPDNYDAFLQYESKRPGVLEDWELDYKYEKEEDQKDERGNEGSISI